MQITKQALSEFIAICEEEHGVRLEEGEAMIVAKRLLSLYELMHRPLPNKQIAMQPPGEIADLQERDHVREAS